MAGVCVEKLPHSCGTRQGLQVYADPETGAVTGFCHSCQTYIPDPYGDGRGIDKVELPKPKTPEEIQEEINFIRGLPTVDLPTRKLRKVDLEFFGIKVGLSEQDGKTPSVIYSPFYKDGELKGYLAKTLVKPSITWSIGDTKGCELFNWHNVRAERPYKVIITEGVEDAVAVRSMFRRHGKEEYMPGILSLPRGAGSVKAAIGEKSRELNQYKELILCFDGDEVGRKAVEEAMLLLPNAKTVDLPEKDANECLIKGVDKAAFKVLSFHAEKPHNSRVVDGHSFYEEAREPTPWGEYIWPFPKLQELLRGIRLGETIYIGAGVKMGKSDLLDELATSLIKNHGIDILLVKPEEENKITWKKLCGKVAESNFTDPSINFNYEKYDKASEVLKGHVKMIDLYQHLSWETLKSDIIYAAGEGVKAVFIDPITNLTNGMDSGKANELLQSVAQDLSAMAKDLNIVIFVFCHLKANDGFISKDNRQKKYEKGEYVSLGLCPHEFGGDISSNQFAGSRGMMRSCNLMIALEGNKDDSLPDEIKRRRWLTVLEDRAFGMSASIPLIWNRETTRYKGL